MSALLQLTTKNEFPSTPMELLRKKENTKLSFRKNPLGVATCLNVYYCYSPDVEISENVKMIPKFEDNLIKAKIQILDRVFKRNKLEDIKYSNLTCLTPGFNYVSAKTTEKILKQYSCKNFREYVTGITDPFKFFLYDLNYKIREINEKIQDLNNNIKKNNDRFETLIDTLIKPKSDNCLFAPIDVDFHAISLDYETTEKGLVIENSENHSIQYTFKFTHKDKRLSCVNQMSFVYIDNLNFDPFSYTKIPQFKLDSERDSFGNIVFSREPMF